MNSENSTVLVVDDEHSIRTLLVQFLRRQGHQVRSAENGQAGLDILAAGSVDLVLLDMMMPGMTGIEVLRRIKANPAVQDVPVVIVSSESDVANIAACIKLGAEDYVPKPFDPVILEARVSACLERRSLRKQERAYQAELERRIAERTKALQESEERYALAARGANDGLWDWNLQTNMMILSPRWKAMLGYADEDIGSTAEEWLGRVHPEDRERLEVKLQAHFRQLITHFQHEYRIRHQDGTYRWMLCRGLSVWDESGIAMRIAGSQTDITERKHAEQRLLHDALHDGLTGLPNRTLFLDRLKHALARSQRDLEASCGVLFLDLDRFKVINDSLGHVIGDQLLEAVARRLETCVRPGDTVARLGGDEFTILVEDVADEGVVRDVADRIQRAIAEPLQLAQHTVITTASVGMTLSSLGYSSAIDMVRDADTAMYHAKLRGKAQTVMFDLEMHAAAIEQLQVESGLRWAVERGELRVHYQPIVSLESGHVIGFEALLRWQHSQRGLLLPGDFIGIAEDTGLVVPIGWWVLRVACEQLQDWHQLPGAQDLWVSVNVSAKQLVQPDVVVRVISMLEELNIPTRCVKLEITETALIEHGDKVNDRLQQLRQAGIQICLDDFGTGYSSLSYLQRLPVDALKIDRSFIQQLNISDQREIVHTIIKLAQLLGLQSVAEGTETAEQVEHLQGIQCDYGQGWLFAKALQPEQAQRLIESNQVLLRPLIAVSSGDGLEDGHS
jgi:diguanylate cyclase (GGDEF)-like protein/PAS domain S-box-containing protein